MNHEHLPVLLEEVVDGLAIRPEGIYIDATFGRGGHSSAILSKLNEHGRLIALDRDYDAIQNGQLHFANDKRFKIFHASFSQLSSILEAENLHGKINGILFDLGLSSPQIDNAKRGFSFMHDGPLDMRIDVSQKLQLSTWLQTVSLKTLSNVLWQYGEERFSRRIARAIINQRPFSSTKELAAAIAAAIPKKDKYKHPATRSFQALRIVVNEELLHLEQGLKAAILQLLPQGRLVVLSFHSLEDRIVKQSMRFTADLTRLLHKLPIKHAVQDVTFKEISRAIFPTQLEISNNVRARSAILRVGEKL